MRRALLAAALGGVLLSGAACSGGDNDATTASDTQAATPTTTTASPEPDYSADTKKVCESVQTVFDEELEDFGTQVGKMIAYKEAKQDDNAEKAEKAAAKELESIGDQVRDLTAEAQNPEIQEAGATSADKFAASAKDTAFFDKIKTTGDLDKVLEDRMTEWLNPIAGLCA